MVDSFRSQKKVALPGSERLPFAADSQAARFAARGIRGGVSDMTLLYLWARASGNADPINRVLDGKVIDHNINSPHNHLAHEFRYLGGAKRIAYADGRPWLTRTAGGRTNVVALHFQGSAKMAMPHALHGRMRTVAAVTYALMVARRAKNKAFRLATRVRRTLDALGLANAPAAK